jgi:guanylate kinase
VLEQRLHSRAQDADRVVAGRMAKSAEEIGHWAEYDYVIVNDTVADSVAQARAIVTAERLRRPRQTGLRDFVATLRAG